MKTSHENLNALNDLSHLFNFHPYKTIYNNKLKKTKMTAYFLALSTGLVISGILILPSEKKHAAALLLNKNEALLFAELEALSEDIKHKEIALNKLISQKESVQLLNQGRGNLVKLLQSIASADDELISIEGFDWDKQTADIYCFAQTPEAIEIWLALVESKLPNLITAKVYDIERGQISKDYPYEFKAKFVFKANNLLLGKT